MSRFRSNTAAALAIGALALMADCAYAQTARSGGGPSAQLIQQMQQLASERTSLQAENAKLKKDLEGMRKERDTLKSAQQALDRRAKTSEVSLKDDIARRESTEQELAQTKEKTQQLIAKFREVAQALRDSETQQAATKQTLATSDQALKTCVDHNLAFYKLNQEVLARLENQTLWARVAATEPFTRVKRNQLENLVDDYKAKADDQLLAPAGSPGSPSADVKPH
jgi:chromosome segregation ATPase